MSEDQSRGKSKSRFSLEALIRGVLHREDEPEDFDEALADLLDEWESDGDFKPEDRIILRNILGLRARKVADCMVPRADILAVPMTASIHDILAAMARDGHSRVPIYDGTLDKSQGFIHIKDIIPLMASGNTDVPASSLMRPLPYVAPSMPVPRLLMQMRQDRCHIALVVDEFGGVDGLVTIENLIEEIVGDIEDEHDHKPPSLQVEADGCLLVDARLPLDELTERTGLVLRIGDTMEQLESLGGVIVALADRVPLRGEMLRHPQGHVFEILDADRRRVKQVRIRPASHAPLSGGAPHVEPAS